MVAQSEIDKRARRMAAKRIALEEGLDWDSLPKVEQAARAERTGDATNSDDRRSAVLSLAIEQARRAGANWRDLTPVQRQSFIQSVNANETPKMRNLARDLARRYKAEMATVFGPDLLEEVDWRHGDPNFEDLKSDYYELWKKREGGHKKYNYFSVYDRLFGSFRNKRATMLELGVYKGASLKSWQEFLGDGSVVVGVDINPECLKYDDAASRRHVRIGDQCDPRFLAELSAELGPFDIILDDASHRTDHQIASFNSLFVRHLSPAGIYFIEDTNTSLWNPFRQGDRDIFDLIKALGLATHIFYADHYYSDYERSKHPRTFKTLAAAKFIEEVRVVDAGVAIFKARDDYYPPLVDHR